MFSSVSAATDQTYYDPEGGFYLTEKDNELEFEAVISLDPEATTTATETLAFKGDIVGNGSGTITAQVYQTAGSNHPCHLNMQLQRKQTGGNWTKVAERTIGYTANRTNISVSTNNKTSYWRIVLSGTVGNQKLNTYFNKDNMIFNRKAVLYPAFTDVYVDPGTFRTVPIPATNYQIVPESQRVSRAGVRERYIKDYKASFPLSPVSIANFLGFEIHHIIPIQYGGTNVNSNLIALPTTTHKKYSAWWINY